LVSIVLVVSEKKQRFFSETTRTVEIKRHRNDHWKVLYKLYVFYADGISKMAATAIHRLILRNFVEDLPMIIPGQFGFNCASGFREEDWKSKMAANARHRLTLDPMGKMFQNASSLKPLGQLKPFCPGMIIGRSSIKFLFFIGSNVNLCPAVAAILDFRSA
jgi:hypothetical protein